jgi:hypothetical protein
MDGFCEEVLARLPLAEAVMILWRRIADEEKLQAVFDKHRGRCDEKDIRFATVVRLVADALLRSKGSGNQSFSRAKELGDLEASTRAVYGKLGRMTIELSVGLFADMNERLRELFPAESRRKVFAALKKHSILIIDGKTMKRVAKRLKPLRSVKGGVIGGKVMRDGSRCRAREKAILQLSPTCLTRRNIRRRKCSIFTSNAGASSRCFKRSPRSSAWND